MTTLREKSRQTSTHKLCEGALISLPNALSLLRILLTPLFLYFAFNNHENTALLVFVTAAITDWADGYAARKLNQNTKVGQILDPLADKILLTASFIGFYFLDTVPLWLLVLVVGRDIVILLIGLILLAAKSLFDMKPHFVSKLNTTLQILYIALILCRIPSPVLDISSIIVAFTTVASGAVYAINLVKWLKQRN
ncbi:MAG: CDP-alcohol phosphatidyltransferase family protein [Alphaproteobacteria bacterium]|nr:CDP-alcohol phosphatidyltransferase family protein [Alphaproteobacteria bacterium]